MWIEELDNGKYKYVERYKDHSGKWRKVSLTHMKKNNSVKKEMTKRLQKKIDKKLATNSIKKVTFKEVSEEWLEIYKRTVKHNTYAQRKSLLISINECIGQYEISTISAGVINNFLLDQLNQGLTYSTVKYKEGLIVNVLEHAVKFGYIENDTTSQKLHVPLINVNKKNKLKYLEKHELKEVIKKLEEYPVFRRVVIILASTGLRYGELVAVHESDIDFKSNSLNITKTWNGNYRKFNTPKTGDSRIVYFNDSVKQILKEQINHSKQIKLMYNLSRDDDLVFINKEGLPLNLRIFNRRLGQINLKSGKKITTHYFRHTYVTMMVQDKVDRHLIARQIGHSSLKMIDEVYAHFTEQMEREQKEMQLNNFII